jgi:transcriptional regulator with XRE-family HTH domain
MPPRRHIDPFVVRFGQRFHELRKEHGYTLDDLTQGAQLGGKGYLSQFERGMALPTLVTLDRIARFMGLDLVDLVNFTERGVRNQVIEMTRGLTEPQLKQVLAQAAAYSLEESLAAAAPAAACRVEPRGRPGGKREPRGDDMRRKTRGA